MPRPTAAPVFSRRSGCIRCCWSPAPRWPRFSACFTSPSRDLRWTRAKIAEARDILGRLNDYREQSRALRDLGAGILSDWNHLIERSVPVGELRADSPSLPMNQEDSKRLPRPATLDSNKSIEILPSD